MKTFVIVNPRAGSGRTGRRWPEISKSLSAAIGPFEHAFTNGNGDATALARQAIDRGMQCIIAVGGDGTISETVNGYADADANIRDGCSFAAISARHRRRFCPQSCIGGHPLRRDRRHRLGKRAPHRPRAG